MNSKLDGTLTVVQQRYDIAAVKHVLPPQVYEHAAFAPHVDAHDDAAARQAFRYLNGWSTLMYRKEIGRRLVHGDSAAESVWENEGGLLAAVN